MKTKVLIITAVITGLFFLLPEPNESIEPTDSNEQVDENSQSFDQNFIISKVRLFDGFKVFEETDVLIENNKIANIAVNIENKNNFPVLDAQGKTLIPGLIDAHTHAYGEALEDALNFGVTTELDMFTMPAFAQDHFENRDSVTNTNHADLFSATILATTTNGHGTQFGFDIPVLNHVDEVEGFVVERINDGADFIKAVYNSELADRKHFPSVSYEVMVELVESAHKNNRMLVVHVDNLISAKEVINAGADGIVHSFMDSVVDDEFIQSMLNNNAFVVPTLSVLASAVQLSNADELLQNQNLSRFLSKQQKQQLDAKFPAFGIPEQGFRNAMESVSLLAKAGVSILAGSDAPNPGTTHGATLHGELMFLVKAGMTEQQVLHSATGAVSEHFDVGLRGTLKTGAMASMVLLNNNPFDDITHTQNIAKIWKNGSSHKRTTLANTVNNNSIIQPGLVSDFNASLTETQIGQGIIESTDQMAGGKSTVELNQKSHENSEDSYLHVKGEILKGFMYRWSGFSYMLSQDPTQAVNFSQIKQLTFDAKSIDAKQELALLLFEKGSFQPVTHMIKLSKEWQNHVVELSQFKAADLTEVSNISFVISQELGEYEFMIDNIELK
ncbi:amidohydrolase family protein [Marinicella sp. S1101]|uniref:amidohydrolase family protein n=1 Tax=Marinicella marina TaxID=2996016 RepID=UPI002260D01D|nr:amidohydrolase family protein [Marinicella marina]MCX7553997.1 amidohydrolase family protein [Marinicella marina]MDJ1140489.1 amidohydrolase family protein [Marinicella marina]